MLVIERPGKIEDLRELKLVGYDKSKSERDHLKYLHYYFAPTETKDILRLITSDRIVPLAQININEVTSYRGLFSWELTSTGKRTFFTAEYDNIFKLFSYVSELHLYEVIPEGKPCHLYFDVEFLFAEHPDWNGSEIMERLIDRVDDKLLEVFGQDEYELIHLDATTPKKFSRHLVFKSRQFCFRNNAHVGKFVQEEILTVKEFADVVDFSVYSKNRNFRCIWSTKKANGVNYPLHPLDGSNESPVFSSLEFFRKSLICDVGPHPHLIGYPDLIELQKAKPTLPPPAKQSPNSSPLASSDHATIEQMVLSNFAPTGRVSRTKFNPLTNMLNFMIDGTRFCRHIGREHKSNHIYVSCRLTLGDMVQKCTDPDCRTFASDPVPIPSGILEKLRSQYTPDELPRVDIPPRRENLRSLSFNQILEEIEKSLADD